MTITAIFSANQLYYQVNDSVQVDIATGKIQDNIKFDTGNLCMVTGNA